MARLYDYALEQAQIGGSQSHYGWRIHPISGKKSFHYGVDLTSKTGNRNLYAIEEGYVQLVVTGQDNKTTGFGNRIWIRYPRINKSVMYAHCEKIYLKKKDIVKKGDVVAREGKTGAATGVHLHFGMTAISSDTWLNPETYDYNPPEEKDIIIHPAERDESKNQLKVLATNLRVRREPSTKSEVRGFVKTGKIYNYLSTKENEGYVWYQIDDIQWIANVNLEIYPKKEEEDPAVIEQLKKELEENKELLKKKDEEIKAKDEEMKNYTNSFKKLFKSPKNGFYKIYLKENENLYVK